MTMSDNEGQQPFLPDAPGIKCFYRSGVKTGKNEKKTNQETISYVPT